MKPLNQLLTNICIPVILNNFSQLKMARHNGHLIKKHQSQHINAHLSIK